MKIEFIQCAPITSAEYFSMQIKPVLMKGPHVFEIINFLLFGKLATELLMFCCVFIQCIRVRTQTYSLTAMSIFLLSVYFISIFNCGVYIIQ